MTQVDLSVLRGLRVLLVEDEPLLAMALADDLEDVGVEVVGPVSTVDAALDMIGRTPIDAAILDVELQRICVYPVADLLKARGTPFIITTGHDAKLLPERFVGVPNHQKPALAAEVLKALAGEIRL